jgi:hypothetical protein
MVWSLDHYYFTPMRCEEGGILENMTFMHGWFAWMSGFQILFGGIAVQSSERKKEKKKEKVGRVCNGIIFTHV